MSTRVYLLLDLVQDKSDQVTENLQGRPGVVIADPLQGPPDVMIVVEASDRQSVAELAIRALASVETMTRGVRVLPTRDGLNTHIMEKLRQGNPEANQQQRREKWQSENFPNQNSEKDRG